MDFTLDSTEKIISIVGASMAGLFFILKKVIVPRYRQMKEHFLKIREMMNKVNHVYYELTPNGGGSMKDDIKNIKASLSQVHDLSLANNLKIIMLFNTSEEALFECNLKGEIIWINEAFQDMWGLDAVEMGSDGWLSVLHPDDISHAFTIWKETIFSSRPYRARYRIIHPITQKESWVEATATVLRDSHGRPLTIWGKINKIQAE